MHQNEHEQSATEHFPNQLGKGPCAHFYKKPADIVVWCVDLFGNGGMPVDPDYAK